MSLVIGVLIGFAFLDSPERWFLIAGALAWEGFEIALFLKWRKVKARSGHETLVGAKGIALTDCRPEGQAKIRGQIWKVVCPEGAERGRAVEVTSTDGLTLTVTARSEP